jgi:hypothetical protein
MVEPGAPVPGLPDLLREPVTMNHRIVGQVAPADVTRAITWAQELKNAGVLEEYLLGPATLEDVYIRLVKNPEEAAVAGEVAR